MSPVWTRLPPTACAVGCILSPLRGWACGAARGCAAPVRPTPARRCHTMEGVSIRRSISYKHRRLVSQAPLKIKIPAPVSPKCGETRTGHPRLVSLARFPWSGILQFADGSSAWSMTSNCTGSVTGTNFNPSCCWTASISGGPLGTAVEFAPCKSLERSRSSSLASGVQ